MGAPLPTENWLGTRDGDRFSLRISSQGNVNLRSKNSWLVIEGAVHWQGHHWTFSDHCMSLREVFDLCAWLRACAAHSQSLFSFGLESVLDFELDASDDDNLQVRLRGDAVPLGLDEFDELIAKGILLNLHANANARHRFADALEAQIKGFRG
jgi:hypothetical protein